jgi:hypothetical protein
MGCGSNCSSDARRAGKRRAIRASERFTGSVQADLQSCTRPSRREAPVHPALLRVKPRTARRQDHFASISSSIFLDPIFDRAIDSVPLRPILRRRSSGIRTTTPLPL